MDAGDDSGEPTASYDGSVDGRWGCPGEALASVSSAFESFEARVLHVVLSAGAWEIRQSRQARTIFSISRRAAFAGRTKVVIDRRQKG
jgi:hypothetical protein